MSPCVVNNTIRRVRSETELALVSRTVLVISKDFHDKYHPGIGTDLSRLHPNCLLCPLVVLNLSFPSFPSINSILEEMNHSACYSNFSLRGLTIYFVALKDNLATHRTLASYFLLYWAHYSFLFKYLESQPPLMFLLKYLLHIVISFPVLFCIQKRKENSLVWLHFIICRRCSKVKAHSN